MDTHRLDRTTDSRDAARGARTTSTMPTPAMRTACTCIGLALATGCASTNDAPAVPRRAARRAARGPLGERTRRRRPSSRADGHLQRRPPRARRDARRNRRRPLEPRRRRRRRRERRRRTRHARLREPPRFVRLRRRPRHLRRRGRPRHRPLHEARRRLPLPRGAHGLAVEEAEGGVRPRLPAPNVPRLPSQADSRDLRVVRYGVVAGTRLTCDCPRKRGSTTATSPHLSIC